MKKAKKSILLSIIVCWSVSVVLGILIFAGPKLFELYMTVYRGFLPDGQAIKMLKNVFTLCFYPSSVCSTLILYSLLKLLYNIKKGKVFIMKNVFYLKTVSICCFFIGIITFIGGFFYMPMLPIAAAGIFVGMLLRVLKNVMQSAVEIREENDLTI